MIPTVEIRKGRNGKAKSKSNLLSLGLQLPSGHCTASLSLSKLEQLRLHQRRQWSLRFCWTPYLSICSKWHSSWKLYTEQLVGLVPNGVVLPLMQWVGRAHFLYVVRQTHEYSLCDSTQTGVIHLFRYPHYALNCTGSCPSCITYLRYTAFIVLYPPGMTGETWLMYPTSFYKEEKPLLRFLRWPFFQLL
ncbi:unnamed protein product [Malus baccata var. baccata]